MAEQEDIHKRTRGVDLNRSRVNSSYRAALHDKLSSTEVPLASIRQQLDNAFFQPLAAEVSKQIHQIQAFIWQHFDRDIVQLSPIGIAGIDHHITKSSPLKIAHLASKPADLVADPTVQLAAEVWRQRVAREEADIQLGAFHRCLRLQKYDSDSRTPTFEMFGTYDSSVTKNEQEIQNSLINLIENYLDLLQQFLPGEELEVCISHIGIANFILKKANALSDLDDDDASFAQKAEMITQFFHSETSGKRDAALAESDEFIEYCQSIGIRKQALMIRVLLSRLPRRPNVRYTFQLDRAQGIGHYSGRTFMIFHQGIDIVDGGEVDWVAKLISNKKEKGIVTGCGTELLAKKSLALDVS